MTPVDLSPREYAVEFVDGPFARKRGKVTSVPPAPGSLYLLADGGIVAPLEIIAGNPAALELTREAWHYCRISEITGPGQPAVHTYAVAREPRVHSDTSA